MAAKITPSLRAALERLKHGGAVNGALLGWRRQVLINLLPYEEFRTERLLHTLHDARDHFASGDERHVQTFWFGYDTCHVLVCFRQECTLVLIHTRAEEGDFLKRAAETFLEDSQLLLDSLLHPSPDDGGETQPLNPSADPTYSDEHTNFIGRP
ncbi:hypothetical protein EI77_03674 [Prosthecobacter fusiformis]|uniref:Uncharacterized protein n=1 Tax=Prosthecobacter fusiformis TaxID=48464 RepID=A0A4R7RNI2_9BACT|nr:hypothetical protein [Prosthecobacter fusiformis]TDU66579.1 hypothetical protein EI77_03674 [Prosthecobacter fusiformis]